MGHSDADVDWYAFFLARRIGLDLDDADEDVGGLNLPVSLASDFIVPLQALMKDRFWIPAVLHEDLRAEVCLVALLELRQFLADLLGWGAQ